MLQKLKSFSRFLFDSKTSKRFLFRYGIGQMLAYSGVGHWIIFKTPHYKLRLTKSPVAMVLFGDPKVERDEEVWLETVLRPGDVVIDAGANIGTFSLKAASLVGNDGKVFAFEAHPATAALLRNNVLLNKANNIKIIEAALGDEAGSIKFSQEKYDDVNHVDTEGGGISVPLVRLDDVSEIKGFQRIRCLKIDVEGYELPVLKGAEEVVGKTEMVLFEVYGKNCARFGYEVRDLFDWLVKRNFTLVDPDTGAPVDLTTPYMEQVQNILAKR